MRYVNIVITPRLKRYLFFKILKKYSKRKSKNNVKLIKIEEGYKNLLYPKTN